MDDDDMDYMALIFIGLLITFVTVMCIAHRNAWKDFKSDHPDIDIEYFENYQLTLNVDDLEVELKRLEKIK